jgi:heptosyltransferase III
MHTTSARSRKPAPTGEIVPRAILVIRGGALGDFILTLPVLSALRTHFPNSRVEILANPRFASLAIACGLADHASALESPGLAGLFTPVGAVPDAVVEYFARFDLIISYLYDPDQTFQANVTRFTSAKFIQGPHRPDESANIHASDLLFRPLETLGINGPAPQLRLTLSSPPDIAKNTCLALHPGSGSPAKNWPEPKWQELLHHLALETDWNFLLVGGEAEGNRCQRLAATLPSKRVEIAQDLPLVDLAQKIKPCAAFIGHDSGITHLAAALDIPGVVLWPATSEKTWRPRSDKMTVLRDPRGLTHLPTSAVIAALSQAIPAKALKS